MRIVKYVLMDLFNTKYAQYTHFFSSSSSFNPPGVADGGIG